MGAIAIVAGSMLGIGIFLTPGIVAAHVAHPWLFAALWALGGLIALSGAVAYAELGTIFPKAGGDYVFLREVFGPSVAFAAGWMLFVGVFVGSIATIAVPLVEYQLTDLFGALDWGFDPTADWLTIGGLSLSVGEIFACMLVFLLTAINARATKLSTRTQLLLTLVPVSVLFFGGVAMLVAAPAAAPSAEVAAVGPLSLFGITTSMVAIYFAYSGWNAVGYVGGEVVQPERNIPRGLIGGTLLITLLYLVLGMAFVHVLGLDTLSQTIEAGTASATVVGGPVARNIVTLLIATALFGSLNGTVLGGARIAYAMARDGVLPSQLKQLSERSKTPVRALWVQAILAATLIVTGTFELLLQLTSVAMLAMGGLTVSALFVLRRRDPDRPRPYRATGYPWLPGLFLVASAGIIAVNLYRLFAPDADMSFSERVLPVFGLAIFGVAFGIHRIITMRLAPLTARRRARGTLE